MDEVKPEKLETEKMYEGVIQIFERLHKRFITFESQNENDFSEETLNYLSKISGSIGYMAQVHSGLAKAYQHERRLADIERKIEKIPPEILKDYLKTGR